MTGLRIWLRNLPGTILIIAVAAGVLIGIPVAAHYAWHGRLPELPSLPILYLVGALVWTAHALDKRFRLVDQRIDRLQEQLEDRTRH